VVAGGRGIQSHRPSPPEELLPEMAQMGLSLSNLASVARLILRSKTNPQFQAYPFRNNSTSRLIFILRLGNSPDKSDIAFCYT
jgi:hypothetical protein